MASAPTVGIASVTSTKRSTGLQLGQYWQVNRSVVERILFQNLRTGPGRVLYPQQSFSIAEDVLGGYVMANFKGERWRSNVGVRYVNTDQTSNGNVVSPNGAVSNPYGNYDPISVGRVQRKVHERRRVWATELERVSKVRFSGHQFVTLGQRATELRVQPRIVRQARQAAARGVY